MFRISEKRYITKKEINPKLRAQQRFIVKGEIVRCIAAFNKVLLLETKTKIITGFENKLLSTVIKILQKFMGKWDFNQKGIQDYEQYVIKNRIVEILNEK